MRARGSPEPRFALRGAESWRSVHTGGVALSRADRRGARYSRVVEALGEPAADRALDLLELVELAWHDCYSEITPPEQVIDDILTLSEGTLSGLIAGAHLAVVDWRDARVAADALRNKP
jgi:hypothetical protein